MTNGKTGFLAYEKRFWFPSVQSRSYSPFYYSYEVCKLFIPSIVSRLCWLLKPLLVSFSWWCSNCRLDFWPFAPGRAQLGEHMVKQQS